MWMCLLTHFVLKNVYVPFRNCKYYVSIFHKVWVVEFWTWWPHSTQNAKYNSVALLLGYNQVLFHPEVLDFLPIYFPHILSISGKPHLFSWELIVQSLYVHLKDRKEGWGYKLMFTPFEIVSICVWLWYFFSETCHIGAYSQLHK